MNKYKIMYKCNNGYEGVEYIYAVNRIAAFEIFNALGLGNITGVECFRVTD